MAVRAAAFDRSISKAGEVLAVTWTGLTQTTSDTGDPIKAAEYSDKTFHCFGTFGVGGSLVIEGSNDGTNWAPVSNRQGVTPFAFTALGINTSQDKPIWMRPRVTAGDGSTSLTVVCAAHRSDLSMVG